MTEAIEQTASQRKPRGGISLAQINQMLENATPEERAEFVRLTGLSQLDEESEYNQRITDEDIASLVLRFGDVIRTEKDYLPVPPEWIAEQGPEAVAQFHKQWKKGHQARSRHGFTDIAPQVVGQ